jgi:hypothetical protein
MEVKAMPRNDPLAIYLHDHLAGAKVAIDLLGAVRDQHAREPLGQFAAELLVEIEEDRAVLRQLGERVGAGRSSRVKEGIAWLIEKGTRVKLHRRAGRDLGTLQMLETLALGILGKLALWQALAAVAAANSRLHSVDFDHLAARAQVQHDRVEERRLEVARAVLRADPK